MNTLRAKIVCVQRPPSLRIDANANAEADGGRLTRNVTDHHYAFVIARLRQIIAFTVMICFSWPCVVLRENAVVIIIRLHDCWKGAAVCMCVCNTNLDTWSPRRGSDYQFINLYENNVTFLNYTDSPLAVWQLPCREKEISSVFILIYGFVIANTQRITADYKHDCMFRVPRWRQLVTPFLVRSYQLNNVDLRTPATSLLGRMTTKEDWRPL